MEWHITFGEQLFDDVRRHLLQRNVEEVAILFAHQVKTELGTGLIVSRWQPVPMAALSVQRPDQFAMDGAFVVRHVKVARAQKESILLAHSHPGDIGAPRFSEADTQGEQDLYALLQARLPSRVHGAVVFSPGGVSARLRSVEGRVCPAAVRVVGRRIVCYPVEDNSAIWPDPTRARQELIWGSQGQNLLRHSTVGVVGAGGTGSIVSQQLIHLGVGHLIVVDPETLTASNLARVVGARADDVDRTAKVEIVARLASQVDPRVKVTPIAEDVCQASVLRQLIDANILFLCTHGHYSRAVINAIAVQYRIPVLDLGFRIDMNQAGNRVAAATGEVRLVVPGGYCLACASVLDSDRIKAEQSTPEMRAAFPNYFANLDVPDPSVITLNSTVASLAVGIGVDMLLPTMRVVSPFDSYRFNALKGLVRHEPKPAVPECGICGIDGLGGLADNHPLPCA
jgi:molybdopterin/thiamine biosynthesis adenylyltransferase/proteasome lid subunit RPN8/RPN11